MPLFEDEPKYTTRKLLIVGLPLFILAVAISFCTHQYAHIIVNKIACGSGQENSNHTEVSNDLHDAPDPCALAAFAGPSWTFFLALVSFAFLVRHPQNLFIASMAFINASSRIPETVTVFLQILFHNKAKLVVDESSSIALLHLHDPTIAIVILFFFSLAIACLTITVLHDIKMVRWKWPIALVLFLLMGPLENLLWNVIKPLLS
jgi:hypothetical protein